MNEDLIVPGKGLGFESELEAISAAIASVDDDLDVEGAGAESLRGLLEHLQTAEEELRVADEEVRAQHDELARLVSSQRSRRWQHERLLAVLPCALLVTGRQGSITSVNAAAASLLGMRVDRLLSRPIQSLLDPSDRTDIRRLLATATRDGAGGFRRVVTLMPRSGEPVVVEAVVAVHQDPVNRDVEVTWLILSPEDPVAVARSGRAPTAVARALVDLTQLPLHLHDPHSVLRTAAAICQRALDGAADLSVTVGEPSSPSQIASTGKLAQRVDGGQMISGEGPCEEAWRTRALVTSVDLLHDPRWRRLGATLEGVPVRGAMGVPLAVGEQVFGVLNIYGDGEFGDEQVQTAELLGAAVAAILYEFEVKADLESAAHNYHAALASRAVIDQAKGIIMATKACSAAEAFEVLVSMSSRNNLKLRDIAAQLVAQAGRADVGAEVGAEVGAGTPQIRPIRGIAVSPELGEPTV